MGFQTVVLGPPGGHKEVLEGPWKGLEKNCVIKFTNKYIDKINELH